MELLNQFRAILSGQKTYICAFIIAFCSFLHYIGKLDTDSYITIAGLFGAGGMASQRRATKKLNVKPSH